jgi:chromosome partitioning protein
MAKKSKALTSILRAGASSRLAQNSKKSRKEMPRPAETRIISICNQKGGCGKTTTVINVAAGLASMGQRVLVIDLDAQCNSTVGLGIDADEVEKSVFDLLVDQKHTGIEDVVLETEYENLHVAPASIELSEFDSRVASEIGRENRMKKALARLPHVYDFILIDTPPSLGLLSVNALNAAKEVHIAMQAHPFALDGLNLLLETIEQVKEEINRGLSISGIVVTMFDPRTKISREIVDRLMANEELKDQVYKTVIRQNVKITEASKVRKPVMYYDFNCTGSEDYLDLCEEIAKRSIVAPIAATPAKSRDQAARK